MNQSKFSLADLITVLTAFAFAFICFLGIYFFTLGNTKQSLLFSVIIAVLLVGLALGAKLLKRTTRNFKTRFIWEVILLILFTISIIYLSIAVFPHYFTVSAQKEAIGKKLTTNITQAKNMYEEYERYAENRENLYKKKLKSVVAAKNVNPAEYTNFGFVNDNISDDIQIENKMFTVHSDLFPSNHNQQKQRDSIWLSSSQSIIEKWKPIGLVGVVKNIEQNSKDRLSTLIQLSTIREKGELTEDFSYNLSFEDVKSHFETPGKPSVISILLAMLTYLLMLFSWFVTKRDSKFPGILRLFGKGNTKTDEVLL